MILTYKASFFYVPLWLEKLIGHRERRILEQDDCIVTCCYPETLNTVITRADDGALKMMVEKETVTPSDYVKYVYSPSLGEWFSFNWKTKTIAG